MLIRSHDNEKFVHLENVSNLYIEGDCCGFCIMKDAYCTGRFSTERQARKVLQDISKRLTLLKNAAIYDTDMNYVSNVFIMP